MQTFTRRAAEKFQRLPDSQKTALFEDLSASMNSLESIFQSLLEGILVVSSENDGFRLLNSNNAAKRLVSRHTKSAENPVWEQISDKEIASFLESNLKARKTNVSDEFTIETQNGSIRFLEISIAPFQLADGGIGSIVRADDITEKKRQEILLHRMETMAGLTNIAANVAHEIKNPLGAISIHIQLLQKSLKKKRSGDGKLPEKKFAEDYLDVVSEEIERLNKIVVNFLLAVRPISANLVLANPNALLKQFADFFAVEFREKKIDFCVNLGDFQNRVLLDEKLFREILVNLAQNALFAVETRFSGMKGGKIEMKSKIRGDDFVLTFSDNGSGMDDQTLSRIFEPYFTTKADGTGLGLSVVYKIIKEFSGDIRAESHLGEGTVFTISIPLAQTKRNLLTFSSGEKR